MRTYQKYSVIRSETAEKSNLTASWTAGETRSDMARTPEREGTPNAGRTIAESGGASRASCRPSTERRGGGSLRGKHSATRGSRIMELAVLSDTPEVLHVAVRGAIVMNNRSEPLGEQLGNAVYARRVLFNLAEATYIDSGGVSWLIICHKRFLTNGGKLVLHSVPDLIRKV